jgi:PAS domain S-box-containing protein
VTVPTPRDDADPAAKAVSGIEDARRVLSWAIVVVGIGVLTAFASYLWDWSEVFIGGEAPERDEWLELVGAAWLPVVVVAVIRLVRAHRALTTTALEALDAFDQTVHTSHGWAWRIDRDQRILHSSGGIRALLGYDPEDVLGGDVLDLLYCDESRPLILARLRGEASTKGWDDWQTRLKHRDGSVRHVRSSVTPIRGSGDRIVAYRGFTTDVTAEVVAAAADRARELQEQDAHARISAVLADPRRLQIVFQPIVDVHAHRTIGLEALSRFAGEPYRTPDLWFDEAWQVGLGPALELHAIGAACAQLATMPAGTYLSVNVSPQTMSNPRFTALLSDLGADARRIVVEVTEHAAVTDYDVLAAAVRRLRGIGARVAVDEAGAG